MKLMTFGGIVALLLAIVLSSCAPSAVPPPSPAPAPAAAPAAPALTPEEAAWQKVVAAAKKEGKLTAYSYHLHADVGLYVKKAFTERTGIELDIISGPSGVLVERVKAERRMGTQIASVQTGAGALVRLARQDGMTQKIVDLPELRDESIWRYDPWLDKDYILSLFQITVCPWINTKLVPAGTEPKSWRDLLKPGWTGKIGMPDPDSQPPPVYIYYALSKRGSLDEAYFQELAKQRLQFQPTVRIAGEALARGEVPLVFSTSGTSMMPFLQEGAPLKAIDMAEGVVTYRSGGVVLYEGAPQPNAARVFINFLFSKEGQMVFHKYTGSVGYRKDVPAFTSPQDLLNPANPYLITLDEEIELSRIQRERTLSKILRAK